MNTVAWEAGFLFTENRDKWTKPWAGFRLSEHFDKKAEQSYGHQSGRNRLSTTSIHAYKVQFFFLTIINTGKVKSTIFKEFVNSETMKENEGSEVEVQIHETPSD